MGRANKGRPINPHWLSKRLRGRIKNPPRSIDWWEGPETAREHKSGYVETQLRARPEIIESTSDRVNIEFTTVFSYHIWWS
jgi:hypothetical protein